MKDVLDDYVESRKTKPSYDSIKATCGLLKPFFGNLEPQHITQVMVNRWATQRQAAGKAGSTIYTDMLFLRSSVNWAIKQKILPPSAKLTFEMPVRRSKARDRWLSREDALRLIEAARSPHIRMFLALGFMTGHRREALLSLTWGQVDMDTRRIDFGPGSETKRRAVVPINDFLMAELQAAWRVATTKYVVEYGGDRVRDIRRGLEEACKRAGIARITPHVMRHTAATWLAMSPGVSTREAARMLAMSETVFERTYGKHSPDYLADAAKALSF